MVPGRKEVPVVVVILVVVMVVSSLSIAEYTDRQSRRNWQAPSNSARDNFDSIGLISSMILLTAVGAASSHSAELYS